MSVVERIRPRAQTLLHLGVLAALLLATMAITVSHPSTASAQSGTPVAATPAAASGTCAPAALVSAPAVPDTVAGVSSGTPVPVTDVDADTQENITALVASLAACLTSGNAEVVSELVTDRYLADAYGAGERLTKADYLALAPSAPVVPVTVVSVGRATYASTDSVTAEVITVQGNQLRTEDWTFLFRRSRAASATPTAGGEGHWLVHQVAGRASAAPQGAAEMTAVQSDYALKLTPSTVQGSNLVVTIENTGDEAHEFLALKLDSGASLDQLIRPTSDTFPTDIHVIGQETVLPGETSTIVFVDLAPGTYTVVCLLPDADGVPHLALGETATFTVS
jgi:hypothetical protein